MFEDLELDVNDIQYSCNERYSRLTWNNVILLLNVKHPAALSNREILESMKLQPRKVSDVCNLTTTMWKSGAIHRVKPKDGDRRHYYYVKFYDNR